MAARPFHTFTATGTNGGKRTYNINELPEGTTIYVIPQEGTPYEYRLQRDIDNNLAWFAYRDGKTVNPHHGNSGTTIVRYALQRPRHATVITTPTRAHQEKNTTNNSSSNVIGNGFLENATSLNRSLARAAIAAARKNAHDYFHRQ